MNALDRMDQSYAEDMQRSFVPTWGEANTLNHMDAAVKSLKEAIQTADGDVADMLTEVVRDLGYIKANIEG